MPNLEELIRDHENLVEAYEKEGLQMVFRDSDPKWLDSYLVDWMRAEMNWQFVVPPPELCYTDDGGLAWGPEVGVLLEPMKIPVPAGKDKARRWLESIGVKVVEVE